MMNTAGANNIKDTGSAYYEAFFNNSSDGFCIIEPVYANGVVTSASIFKMVNPAFKKYFGLTEAVGKSIDVLLPSHAERWISVVKKVLDNMFPGYLEDFVGKTGEYLDIEFDNLHTGSGHFIALTCRSVTTKLQMEHALKKREAELSAIQEIGGVAGVDIDIVNGLTGVRSPEYRRLHGLPETATHETHEQWLKRLHPDDRVKAEHTLLSALEGKDIAYITEYRIVRPSDGQVRWIYAKADIYRDSNGKPIRLLGAHIDITYQKTMEQEVRESKEFLAAIFSEAAVGLSVIDKSGNFIRVNDTLCRLVGRTRKELLLLSVPEITAKEYIEPSLVALGQLINTGTPVSLDKQYRLPDGSLVWANSTLSLLNLPTSPDPVIVIVTADLTERKKAEEVLNVFNARLENLIARRTTELSEHKELMQATLDSTPEMVQVFKAVRNSNNEITDFVWILNNKTSEEYYGQVIGKSFIENNPIVVRTGVFKKFKEVVETGVAKQYEIRYDDGKFNGWFFHSLVKLDDGVVAFIANITERKNAEQEIINLNKTLLASNRELKSVNSELATFSDIAANNYKATLESLYIYLEHIIKNDTYKMSDSGKSNVRRAQSAVQKMKLLTEDIIAFSNIRYLDTHISEVNLQDILDSTINDLSFKVEEAHAHINVEGVLPVIKGYPLLLSLLFYHLLDNALKFTSKEEAPAVMISCILRDLDDNKSGSDLFYEISFKDNGIGFPEEESESIFSIFHRLHEQKMYRGAGIGLAVCRKIMNLHGGFIKANSELGKGSTFCCFFPKLYDI